MLSGIASLIFGAAPQDEMVTANTEFDLKVTPVENEWALVDKHENNDCESSCRSLADVPTPSDGSSSSSSSSPRHKSNVNTPSHSSSHSNSHSEDNPMEESWLLTPPPCFNAGAKRLHRLETNPMENLLIEHPSMSVYNTRGRQSSTGAESNQSESSEIHELDPSSRAVQPHSPRRPRAVAARAGLTTQVELLKPMQLHHQRLSSKKISKNKLERNNKVHCQRRHVRRRATLQQPKAAGKRRC